MVNDNTKRVMAYATDCIKNTLSRIYSDKKQSKLKRTISVYSTLPINLLENCRLYSMFLWLLSLMVIIETIYATITNNNSNYYNCQLSSCYYYYQYYHYYT